MIPQTFIDDVNSRVDLVQFITQYVPELKKAGSDYQACCPFHSESSASFTVSNKKGFYHCFGCGAHGNAINFVMEHEGKKFVEALTDVAGFVGMEIPQAEKPERSAEQKKEAVRYMKACSALNDAQGIYARLLNEYPQAGEYLAGRGVSAESVARFGLGFAPDAWNTLTGSRSFSREVLEDAGLSAKKEGSNRPYDRFRDRIMFPIYGKRDAVIGFGGRAINGQDPKYLNSPEGVVFKKGDHLYGIKQADAAIRANKRAFVVEGYMDVVMLSQFGIENAVASLGTSVTESQMRKLFNLTSHVTFCMDGDAPGQKAAWRAAENILPLLDEHHLVDFMFMPVEMDPDDFVREHGKEAFDMKAAEAMTLTDFILDVLNKSADMQNGESMAQYLAKANEMAEKIKSGVVKLSFRKQIAEMAGISLDTMLDMLKEQKADATSKRPAPTPAIEPGQVPAATEVRQPQALQIVPIAPSHTAPEISIAAKMLAIASFHSREVADRLNIDYLAKFLSSADKEMLFPLLAYLKANPTSANEAAVASLSFNPHGILIKALSASASLLGSEFDAVAEARAIMERFRAMEKVWAVVLDNQKKAAVA